MLAAEPCIAETLYFENEGSELKRAVDLARLAALLRRNRFRTVCILDRNVRPALAALLAGVPQRIGLGLTAQRFFITNPGIDRSRYHDHPIDWLRALMAAMKVPLPSTEPDLQVAGGAIAAISDRFRTCARPWIVLGIGAADPRRDWPDDYWAEFLNSSGELFRGTIFLVGGPSNAARAQSLIERTNGIAAVNACDLQITEVLALLRHADLFVGPDSGPMNLAAAVGTATFGLFGVNRVLSYSKFIHPIAPQGGPGPDGMRHISPALVLEQIKPHLIGEKLPM